MRLRRQGHALAGFTLIEMLVVISIIVILMSILLPALRKTRTVAGQGMCAKQIQNLGQAFHNYINEFMEKLPVVYSTANMETYEVGDFYRGHRPSGFGCLYEADLVADPAVLFCPAVEVYGRDNARETHDRHRDEFERMYSQSQRIKVDYVLGWWHYDAWGVAPSTIGPGGKGPILEEYRRARVAWMADSEQVWWSYPGGRPFFTRSHQDWAFMNVGLVDGSTRAIVEYQKHKPERTEMLDAGVAAGDSYWPRNDRPVWMWWRWFGNGHGL